MPAPPAPSRPTIRRLARYAWAAPTTAAGLPFVLAAMAMSLVSARGGSVGVVDGVVEVHGGLAGWFLRRVTPRVMGGGRAASAMTLGHVVIGRDAAALDRSRPHERVHVCQAERWGPMFLPAYLAASALARLRGSDAYFDNAFEREAYASDAETARRAAD